MTTRKTELGMHTITENTTFDEVDDAISDNATIATTHLLDHNRRLLDIQARIAAGELSGPERDQLVADIQAAVSVAAQISDESISGILTDPTTAAGQLMAAKSNNGHTHTMDDTDASILGKALVRATTAALARATIGAGTSSITLGTSASQAMPGNKTFTKTDVGLPNVDNTSDANKPISLAVAAAFAETDPYQEDILHLRLALRDIGLQNVVILGSSTSNGGNASAPEYAYTSILSRDLHAAYPLTLGGAHPPRSVLGSHKTTGKGIQVIIGAVGGNTSANYADATKRAAVAATNPAAVLHMIGSNDQASGMHPDTYYTNIKTVIDGINASITQPCVHILVHSFRRPDIVSPAYPDTAYRDKLVQLANEASATRKFVDVSVPFTLAGVPGADPYGLKADSMHVGDAGHRIIAETLRDKLHIPKASHDGGVWRDLAAGNGIVWRDDATFRAQYMVDGGLVKYRGGVKLLGNPTPTFGTSQVHIASLRNDDGSAPVANPDGTWNTTGSLFPEFQCTAMGMTSTRDPAMLYVTPDGRIWAWPNVSGASYIMLNGLETPLKNL